MGYKRSKLTKPQIEARRTKAIQYRDAGMTYEQIAKQLGYSSRQTVHKDIMITLANNQHKAVEELRGTELNRLDAAHRAIWPKVLKGDHKAIDSMVKLMVRRARYVPGLEVPQEHELNAGSGDIQVVFSPALAEKINPPEPGDTAG